MDKMQAVSMAIEKKAMAKINLALDVIRKREDGYHEVKMIMQTVDLFDTLSFQKSEVSGIHIITNIPEIPTDKRNLIYKAADMLMQQYSIAEGVNISLVKRIPVAAGMAGGSTDAAATLKGINELFELKIPEEKLRELGVKIGADVPYCIMGGTALSEGIGEILTKLPNVPAGHLVLAKPNVNVSTKMVYENLNADRLKDHPDVDGMIEAIMRQDISKIAERMGNVLETVTQVRYPIIKELKDIMLNEGAASALMSGSGPTVFGLFFSKEMAENAYEIIKTKNLVKQLFVTTFI